MAKISGHVKAGQKTGVGVTAVQIATDQPNNSEVLIQSDPANTTNLLVGDSAGQFVALTPGQSFTLPVFNLSLIYVKMASLTGIVNWFARE